MLHNGLPPYPQPAYANIDGYADGHSDYRPNVDRPMDVADNGDGANVILRPYCLQ